MRFSFRFFVLGLRLGGCERRDLVLENLVPRERLAVVTRPGPRVSLGTDHRRYGTKTRACLRLLAARRDVTLRGPAPR